MTAAGTPTVDLTDAEIAELGELLADLPGPVETSWADGYLCGWVALHRSADDGAWIDPAWPERLVVLLRRRLAALRASIVEWGDFQPLVFEFDEHHPMAVSEYEVAARLPPESQALMPWVGGFRAALETDPDAAADADAAAPLARLYRHLPPSDALERDVHAIVDREQPLAGLDAAIDDLVAAVVEIADLVQARRYRVATVRRDAPKVGRNDPCPCGSGRKFKLCHGASA